VERLNLSLCQLVAAIERRVFGRKHRGHKALARRMRVKQRGTSMPPGRPRELDES
jgi:hypothetical protein